MNSKKYQIIQLLFLFLLGIIFYGNALKNIYALDDAIVLTENKFTRQGVKGIPDLFKYDSFTGFFGEEKQLVTGGRYRPLSLVTFALEYELFELNPAVSHGINLLIYLLTIALLFRLLILVFPSKSFLSFAFLVSVFFLIHPIHTEVVTNIKGRDELLAFFFGILALTWAVKYSKKKHIVLLLTSGILFFLGLLAKENAVVFLVLIPLFLYYTDRNISIKQIFVICIPLVVFFGIFMVIRSIVLGDTMYSSSELMNNPFVDASLSEKAGTILFTLGLYIKLLFVPHPLTYDYYPYHIPLTGFFSFLPLVSLLIYIGLIVVAVVSLKKKYLPGYGIWFFLVPIFIVSNILFPIGTFMNERFLYFSSFGFCIVLGWYLHLYLKHKIARIPLMVLIAVLILASGWKTISRNRVWYDDFTLFTTDVKVSQNSAKSNLTAGGAIYEKALTLEDSMRQQEMLNLSINYLKKALTIHPKLHNAMLLLGNAYWAKTKNLDSTLLYYEELIKLSPGNSDVIKNLSAISTQTKLPEQKIQVYKTLMEWGGDNANTFYKLGNIYGKELMQIDSAIYYLNRAIELAPDNVDALLDMGVAQGISGNFELALKYLLQANKHEPTNRQVLINIGVTYQRMGLLEKAKQYFDQVKNN